MCSYNDHETKDFWSRVADDWRIQVGDEGDSNRLLNSDPVLWKFAGEVEGLKVLDAGCGTGYLSQKLHECGAHVTGIDFSKRMIEIARKHYPHINFRVDSCSDLGTIDTDHFDMIISNYVLMDTPHLQETINAFHRVLTSSGRVILIFSHPCFPQGRATYTEKDNELIYSWKFSYFDQKKCVDPPWGHFTEDFIWFHRSLSDYWKAFNKAGFIVIEFEEPRLKNDHSPFADNDHLEKNYQTRPYSVAFKLQKKV